MGIKLSGICKFCKNNSTRHNGDQYCAKASFKENDYGSFWQNNVCTHDEHLTLKRNLFEPLKLADVSALNDRLENICKQRDKLYKEKTELTELIYNLKKHFKEEKNEN